MSAPAAAAQPAAGAPVPATQPPATALGTTPHPKPATPPAGAAPAAAPATADPAQLAQGKTIYMLTCVACHQPTGAGLPAVFPPITNSPYISGSAERLAAIILKGNAGPFAVDGKPFNNIMTPLEVVLTDDKIAAVMTYVRASFGNKGGPVTPQFVAEVRRKFADRKTPWTQAELDAWKE